MIEDRRSTARLAPLGSREMLRNGVVVISEGD